MPIGGKQNMKYFDGKRILIIGGTGSLGKMLVRRFLSNRAGGPTKLIVFSRDEAKQHYMRMEYQNKMAATDEIIYRNFEQKLQFRIGDVRDFHNVLSALRGVDIVFNAAALKQVPVCEYSPYEAVRTNIEGPENIVRAIQEHNLPIETVVGISTDKACKPINTMGMTKAIQERIFIQANIRCPATRFVCVRYGNVLASRGSVIPLFVDQIRNGGPVTLTTLNMTRFLLTLEQAVDAVLAAVQGGLPGDTYVPRVPSARISDIAKALIGNLRIEIKVTGIRPGEKIHEVLVSEEEAIRTVRRGDHFAIRPMLPELCHPGENPPGFSGAYSSADDPMSFEEARRLVERHCLIPEDAYTETVEVLR
jgi:FlaA1/EpsC-like NDP-sugar epimerase